MSSSSELGAQWAFLPLGYALTVLIETPILLLFLSRHHSIRSRIFAGFWLNACSYPIVILVLPCLISPGDSRTLYLWVAEVFAPLSECLLFRLAFHPKNGPTSDNPGVTARDYGVIILANLASFGIGEWLNRIGWL